MPPVQSSAVPYWIVSAVVSAPLALTVALSRAVVRPICVAAPVTAVGAPRVVNERISPEPGPTSLAARAWNQYVVFAARPVSAAVTAVSVLPVAGGVPLIAVPIAEEIVAELTEGRAELYRRGRRWVDAPLSTA